MAKFTFLISSARKNGNSEQLSRIASESLTKQHPHEFISLRDFPLPPFRDLRHGEETYPPPTGNALTLFNATVNCDHLVLVTPVYWYNVAAPLKLYLDYWSHWMRVADCDFKARMKGKYLWAISVSAGPSEQAQPMFQSLKLCAEYMNMNWGGQVLGNGTVSGDVLKDSAAIQEARGLFSTLPKLDDI